MAGALLAAFVVLSAASYFDWPGIPDAVPTRLLEATDRRLAISHFSSYALGGFLDMELLWRIDASPEVLEAIASKLGMVSSDTAPGRFWRMPPYYWPRSLPAGARLYSTPSFPADTRGSDGDHYFMLVERNRGLVWVKNNF
jgi:hypothetical protein